MTDAILGTFLFVGGLVTGFCACAVMLQRTIEKAELTIAMARTELRRVKEAKER